MWIINICPYKARSRMFLPSILHWKGFIGLTNNKNIELCMTRCLMIMDGHEIDFNQWEPRMGRSWPITGLETNSSPIPVDDLVVCMTFDSGSVVAAVPLYKCMFISLYHPSFYPWRLFTYKATIAWTLRVARYVIKLSLGKQKSFTRHHLYVGLLYNIVH